MITEWYRAIYTVFSQYPGLDIVVTSKFLKGFAWVTFVYSIGFVRLKLFAELLISIARYKLDELDREQRGIKQDTSSST